MIAGMLLGAAIGVLLGLLGGGGSILAVPALVYGAGMPLEAAIPGSLTIVGLSSLTALLPRLREVEWRIAAIFGLTGAATAFAGAAVNRLLPESLVLGGFAVLMVIAGWRMLRSTPRSGGDCALPGGGVNWRGCLPKSIGLGAAVGFLTGLFGVGGGFLIVPALVLFLGLPMVKATATSLVVIVANSISGLTAHATPDADWGLIALFTGAAVIGSLVAARFAKRVPVDRLRRWFALFVLAVAAFVGVSAIAG